MNFWSVIINLCSQLQLFGYEWINWGYNIELEWLLLWLLYGIKVKWLYPLLRFAYFYHAQVSCDSRNDRQTQARSFPFTLVCKGVDRDLLKVSTEWSYTNAFLRFWWLRIWSPYAQIWYWSGGYIQIWIGIRNIWLGLLETHFWNLWFWSSDVYQFLVECTHKLGNRHVLQIASWTEGWQQF